MQLYFILFLLKNLNNYILFKYFKHYKFIYITKLVFLSNLHTHQLKDYTFHVQCLILIIHILV